MPDIGHFTGVEVIEVAIKPGATVKAEETLITLETEKASMDIPSPVNGVVKEIKLKVGSKVSKGDLIALIEVPETASKPLFSSSSIPNPAIIVSEEALVTIPDIGFNKRYEVIEVAVKPGDEVALEQKLLTMKGDTGDVIIPSPYQGKIDTVLIKVGFKLAKDDPVLTMHVSDKSPTAPAIPFVKEVEKKLENKPDAPAAQPVAQVPESKLESSVETKFAESKLSLTLEPLSGAEPTVAEPTSPAVAQVEVPTAEIMTEAVSEKAAAPSNPMEKAAVTNKGMEEVTVTVPDTGGAQQVEVIEVPVKAGDTVEVDGTLITLESEKASMDIPSPHSGKVKTIFVKVGDKVATGDPIAVLLKAESSSEKADLTSRRPSAPVMPLTPEPTPEPEQPTIPGQSAELSSTKDFSGVHAGPATRRLARELGVDLAQVVGTGPKNRVLTKDVQNYVKAIIQGKSSTPASEGGLAIEKLPEIDFSKFGEIEVKPLSRIKKWTGKNLYRNWVTIPHITQFDEADITELEAFREQNKQNSEETGIKLTPLPFIIKAVLSALKAYPQFNASLANNGTDLIFKKYFHIGVAVDTPSGLMVPVIKDVDTKGLFSLAKEINQLSQLAREGKIKTDQMQGSCFTISSLGSIGGTAFTPIINAPDVAILGISKAQMKPVYMNHKFVPRRILPLSLSYDHRVIDGVEGARFTAHIAGQLQDIRKLLL